jgi:hypothetical protein
MRTVALLTLAAAMTALVGCGSGDKDETALAVPDRDLTLATPASDGEIASPVELGQLRAQPQTARRSRSIHRAAAAARAAPAPAPVLRTTDAVAQPASIAEAINDRELPPGKTITIIPVSSGPSGAAEPTDEIPMIERQGMRGGRCPPRRRPGIGIAVRPRPNLY